jgi:DNA polymerase-3 subunit beta
MLLIETDRDTLLKPLQAVTGVVERRHTLPILSNVLIERAENTISFVATDLEMQITTQTLCHDQQQSFAITVAAKKLLDICRALPEASKIQLEASDNRLQVKAGKSRFNLQTLPAQDFPKIAPPVDIKGVIRLTQKSFKQCLNLVQYAMAQQDIRYYLNGLLLVVEGTSLKVVATDGHRLSLASVELREQQAPQEVILPRKTILELVKLLADSDEEVVIEIGQNQAKFSVSNTVLVSKVIDGKFPDFTRVIPSSYEKHFVVPRVTLLQTLQRAAILSNEKFRGVRLVLTTDSLRVICNNNEQEEAQEELEIAYDGAPLDVGFNVVYLLDVLNNLSVEQVDCAFGDANSSMLVTIPGETGFKYVVMPMRI